MSRGERIQVSVGRNVFFNKCLVCELCRFALQVG